MQINAMRMLATVDMGSVMNNPMNMSERLALSLQMIVLGLATVFAVLIIIWGVLVLLRVFMYDAKKDKTSEPTAKQAPAEKQAPAPAPAPAAPVAPTATDDKQLIAVLAAAIAASEGKPASSFRVVSFRRAGSPRWNER